MYFYVKCNIYFIALNFIVFFCFLYLFFQLHNFLYVLFQNFRFLNTLIFKSFSLILYLKAINNHLKIVIYICCVYLSNYATIYV